MLTLDINDKVGNQSDASTVVLDRKKPKAPKITNFFVSGNSGILKGTADANTTVFVSKGNLVIATVIVASKGTFVVKVQKPEKGISEFDIYSIDHAGNESKIVKRSIIIK